MPDVPFVLQHIQRRDSGLPRARLVNLYADRSQTSPNSDVALLSMPRLANKATFSGEALRGIFQRDGVVGGYVFAVVDNDVYYNGPKGTDFNKIGETQIGTAQTGQVLFAGDSDELMMVSDRKLYRITETDVQRVQFYDDGESEIPDILDIGHINGWFLYVFEDGQFGWSRVNDGDTLNALDFATAEYSPDASAGILVEREQIQIFNSETMENWVNTGALDAPFQRRPGGTHEVGLIATLAKCVADNSFYWCDDEGIIMKMADAPNAVSTAGIEEAIQNAMEAGVASQITMWTFTWRAHPFVVVDVPGQGSFALDVRSQNWLNLSTWQKTLYRGFSSVSYGGERLVADRYTPRLLTLTDEALTDVDGDPVEYIATAQLRKIPRNARVNNALLTGRKGLGGNGEDAPQVVLRTSTDGGNTYGSGRQRGLGRIGEYGAQTKFTKLGKVKDHGMLMEFSVTDPVGTLRLDNVKANV